MFLTMVSFVLVLVTLPFSLCVTVKVVQEYERAVVFRLGRLRSGGAKGPGLFFVMPCVDSYKKVDLRTVSFDVPPQEVFHTCWWGVIFGFLLTVLSLSLFLLCFTVTQFNCQWPSTSFIIGSFTGFGDSQRGRGRLLSGFQPYHGHQQYRGLQVWLMLLNIPNLLGHHVFEFYWTVLHWVYNRWS